MPLEDFAAILVHRLRGKIIDREVLPRFLRSNTNTRPVEDSSKPLHDSGDPTKVKNGTSRTKGTPGDTDVILEESGLEQHQPEPNEVVRASQSQFANASIPAEEQIFENEDARYLARQSLRQQEYIAFLPEELEQDYTGGPCRFVLANDGVQEAAALLVTFEMSQHIKKAIEVQRYFRKVENYVRDQLSELARFKGALEIEIRSHKLKIEGDADYDERPSEANAAKFQQELEVLQDMYDDLDPQERELRTRLQMNFEFLRDTHLNVMAYLDEAFVAAVLIQEDQNQEMPIEHFDLEEQYQKYYTRKHHPQSNDTSSPTSPPPLDTYQNTLIGKPPTPDPSEQHTTTLRSALQSAATRLTTAQTEFQHIPYNQWQERNFNHTRLASGLDPIDASKEAFDARWVLQISALTREVLEAEQALREARRAAVQGGGVDDFLDVAPDEFWSGVYPKDRADGRCGSGSELSVLEGKVGVPGRSGRSRVEGWLEEVGERGDQIGLAEVEVDVDVDVDEWEGREVEIWDSASLFEERPYKRKLIDKWQRACRDLS